MNLRQLFQGLTLFTVLALFQTVSFGQVMVSRTGQAKINLTNFTVNSSQDRIMIDWATDNKVPTNYFEIERSSDGINYKTIALVLGADPKQPGCDCYEGFDKPGSVITKLFYRLKHVNKDGEIEFSEARMPAVTNNIL